MEYSTNLRRSKTIPDPNKPMATVKSSHFSPPTSS